ncbi:MAG: hypothetical protein EOP23_10035 [Hyphomicrobiales bacterium]|nr:MAG: hypothetical protein EOP23_10035 [Hyphomicrobiales bacterium]
MSPIASASRPSRALGRKEPRCVLRHRVIRHWIDRHHILLLPSQRHGVLKGRCHQRTRGSTSSSENCHTGRRPTAWYLG